MCAKFSTENVKGRKFVDQLSDYQFINIDISRPMIEKSLSYACTHAVPRVPVTHARIKFD